MLYAQPSSPNNWFQTNHWSIQYMCFLFQVLAQPASYYIWNVGFLLCLIKSWRPGLPGQESCFQILIFLMKQLDKKKKSLTPQHNDFCTLLVLRKNTQLRWKIHIQNHRKATGIVSYINLKVPCVKIWSMQWRNQHTCTQMRPFSGNSTLFTELHCSLLLT